MRLTWEGKSSWAGVRSTKPGRIFVYWVDFTSNGGNGRDRLFGGEHQALAIRNRGYTDKVRLRGLVFTYDRFLFL